MQHGQALEIGNGSKCDISGVKIHFIFILKLCALIRKHTQFFLYMSWYSCNCTRLFPLRFALPTFLVIFQWSEGRACMQGYNKMINTTQPRVELNHYIGLNSHSKILLRSAPFLYSEMKSFLDTRPYLGV